MNTAQIIEACGDTAKVAADLDTTLQVVSNWKLRGFPRSRLLDIVEVAARAGRKDITGDIVRNAKPPPPKVVPVEDAA